MNWLLNNKYKVEPTCERNPRERYTKEVFEETRAQIEDPRTDYGDLLVQFKSLGTVYWRLGAMLLQAYRANKTIYFHHKLRYCLEDLEAEFPRAKDLPMSDDPKATGTELWRRLKQARDQKLTSRPFR